MLEAVHETYQDRLKKMYSVKKKLGPRKGTYDSVFFNKQRVYYGITSFEEMCVTAQ